MTQRRIRRRGGAAIGLLAAAWTAVVAASVMGGTGLRAQEQPPIWRGIYTAAQAERGKATYTTACVRCHGADLKGTTAPALVGEHFMKTWGGDPVERFFVKVRDTMPPNFGTILDDVQKIEVVAYVLQENGYPAGPTELSARSPVLQNAQILARGEQPRVQNFSLVQMVGCLARGDGNTWTLTRTSDPVVTSDDAPGSEALAAAASRALGSRTVQLIRVGAFAPEQHLGHRMEARGLVYLDGEDARVTLTSLTMVGPTCP